MGKILARQLAEYNAGGHGAYLSRYDVVRDFHVHSCEGRAKDMATKLSDCLDSFRPVDCASVVDVAGTKVCTEQAEGVVVSWSSGDGLTIR